MMTFVSRMASALGVAAAVIAMAPIGRLAAWAENAADGRVELDVNWRLHVPVVLVGGASWILSEAVFKEELVADRCRWCGGNAFDDWVRDALRWSDPDTAALISNVAADVVAPLSAFGLTALVAWRDGRADDWPVNSFAVLEAMVLAGDLTLVTKFAASRTRPSAAEDATGMPAVAPTADSRLSFYSGHTSFAFSLAVASGTVVSLRGYRGAPAVWAVGLAAAALTGWMRIAADQHFATDVLAGALVGSAVGFAVPFFFHRRLPEERSGLALALTPSPGGALLSLGRSW